MHGRVPTLALYEQGPGPLPSTTEKRRNASWPGLNSGMRVNSSVKALWTELGRQVP